MVNNYLIQVIKKFSRKEMTYFLEFAHSPYFNKHQKIRALVGYLSEIFPEFTEEKVHREEIFRLLYPGESFDQSKLSLIFTYTSRLLEEFLAAEELKDQSYRKQLFALRQLRRRKLFPQCEKRVQKLEESLQADKLRDTHMLKLSSEIQEEKDRITSEQGKIPLDNTLEQKQILLEQYFLAEKIKDTCEILLRNKLLRKVDTSFLENFGVKALREQELEFLEHPAISVYWFLFQMFEKDDSSFYFKASNYIRDREDQFSFAELQNIYNYLLNFCVGQVNRGVDGFLRELFKLQQYLLDREIIFMDGFLSEWHFKNIVTIGTRLKEEKWVRNFLDDYRDRLHPDIADNAYNYNLAYHYYSLGQLEAVQSLLIRVEYTDPRYNLDAKALLLRTYYDLEEYEPLLSLTEAFRQLIKRNKVLSDSAKRGYIHLFKFTRRAAKIRYESGYQSREDSIRSLNDLQAQVDSTPVIFNATWLKECLKDLHLALDQS